MGGESRQKAGEKEMSTQGEAGPQKVSLSSHRVKSFGSSLSVPSTDELRFEGDPRRQGFSKKGRQTQYSGAF